MLKRSRLALSDGVLFFVKSFIFEKYFYLKNVLNSVHRVLWAPLIWSMVRAEAGIFADCFRVGTIWFWFSWAECVLTQKQGTFFVGIERWCFLTQKRGTGCWSKWQQEIFLIHYFILWCNKRNRDDFFVTGKTMLCCWWHRRSNCINHCVS